MPSKNIHVKTKRKERHEIKKRVRKKNFSVRDNQSREFHKKEWLLKQLNLIKGLPVRARKELGYQVALASLYGKSYASQDTIAQKAGYENRKTVTRHTELLHTFRIITKRSRGYKKTNVVTLPTAFWGKRWVLNELVPYVPEVRFVIEALDNAMESFVLENVPQEYKEYTHPKNSLSFGEEYLLHLYEFGLVDGSLWGNAPPLT